LIARNLAESISHALHHAMDTGQQMIMNDANCNILKLCPYW